MLIRVVCPWYVFCAFYYVCGPVAETHKLSTCTRVPARVCVRAVHAFSHVVYELGRMGKGRGGFMYSPEHISTMISNSRHSSDEYSDIDFNYDLDRYTFEQQ